MFPISDDNPTLHTPWMTYVILALIFAAWVLVQGAGFSEEQLAVSVCNLGLVPAELMHTRPVRPDVSGGVAMWAHIGGFVAGLVLVKFFENEVLVAKRRLIHDARFAGAIPSVALSADIAELCNAFVTRFVTAHGDSLQSTDHRAAHMPRAQSPC